ncbi:MAG: hypothetical protein OXN19_11745 [Caldilineaceae bacterium]|nr:hypothetical protein [Caldilineaceae bacterium]
MSTSIRLSIGAGEPQLPPYRHHIYAFVPAPGICPKIGGVSPEPIAYAHRETQKSVRMG